MSNRIVTAALKHAAEAVGARAVRPGFCFTPADDLAFALGFPYLVRLATDHPDDADPYAVAESILCNDAPYLQATYPLHVAARLARALLLPEPIDQLTDPSAWRPTREAKRLLERAEPITETEARTLAEHAFAAAAAPECADVPLYILEAFVGPGPIVEAGTLGIERGPRDAATLAHPVKLRMRDALLCMCLRLPQPEHDAALARLGRALAHLSPAERRSAGLDALYGGVVLEPGRLVLQAPAERVAEARLAHAGTWGPVPDPRLVFLGGDRVYRAEIASWFGAADWAPHATMHRLIIERFGPIQSPLTAELMTDMLARSAAPEEASAWLETHDAYAKPALQELVARQGRRAADARAPLGFLSRPKKKRSIAATKAASTPGVPPPDGPTTRALQHGLDAVGAADLKPGFCFTSVDDLAFALGFPYLAYLVPDTQDPRAVAERLLVEGYPYPDSTYPRQAAPRIARGLCLPRRGPLRTADGKLRPDVAAALDDGAVLTEAEARERLCRMCEPDTLPELEAFLLVEALLGPDFVSATIIEALRRVTTDRWMTHSQVWRPIVDLLGIIALRLRRGAAEAASRQLSELRQRVQREALHGFDPIQAAEDLASPARMLGSPETVRVELTRRRRLEGQLKLLSSRGSSCGFDTIDGVAILEPGRPVIHARAEAVLRARRTLSGCWESFPNPRLVFLGGDEVYRIERQFWREDMHPTPPGEAHRIIIDQFGRIRSSITVELAVDLATRSRARVAARRWLIAHEAFARPLVAAVATSGSVLAADARTILGQLRW